jgi:Domain of unknown function (DUF4136)
MRGGILKTTVLLAAVLLTSSLARADDHNVDFDKSVDFSKLKTFMIRPGKIDSSRQELNNAIVLEKISDAVRSALLSKGLMEDAAQPNVMVEFIASGVDYNIGPGGIANPINASRGDRGGSRGDPGPNGTGERGPVDFSIGTLVVDVKVVKTTQPSNLIWRGVYHANEKNSARLGQKFPEDAKKLLSEYPGKKK